MRTENGFHIWNKGEHSELLLSYHFKAGEFECHCKHPDCIEQRISLDLISALEGVRIDYKRPLTINSGYRCPRYQKDLGDQGLQTATQNPPHPKGIAADIAGADPKALSAILPRYFKAIGAASTWAHVDTRADKIRRWVYS